ncbi:MAG: ferredoxin--NAD(+) reductase [Hyphomicrobium sp. 32-62-53]|nr:MAG: ferredoxin--NAD(+) reductase [Hyphomicrobium sp. 12-62-95]OYY00120.1 MAG: ferredoxin--NAD(+) reductase [Hyphomicrobium sp. 32-62-53]
MAGRYQISVNGIAFTARHGEKLLDAALTNGIDLPHDCRAGHCGACCVRLVAGHVQGGEGTELGIFHACQCRIAGDAVLESGQTPSVRSVDGVLSSLRPLSPEVMEAGIIPTRALPFLAGQYLKLRFDGYPARPYSPTHPISGQPNGRTIYFHVRRMENGRISGSLGHRIKPGHRVTLSGPYGSAHFRPSHAGRLILVATNTGFAPIWSIAVAALRENPQRSIMIIAGGRTLQSLYMGPALAQLARFPNVLIVPVCSRAQNLPPPVMPGRPTDYLPVMLPSDVLFACGAEEMVAAIKAIAASAGAVCYADPFLPATDDIVPDGIFSRARGWLNLPIMRPSRSPPRERHEPHMAPRQSADTHPQQRLGI